MGLCQSFGRGDRTGNAILTAVIKSLKELDVAGKQVLVRLSFDASDFRLKAALPTLNYLTRLRAKVLVISSLGRPSGWDESLSLLPMTSKLAELLNRKLIIVSTSANKLPEYEVPHLYFFKSNFLEKDLRPLISQMREGDIAVLENLRFYQGEAKAPDPEFGRILASLGSVYVNEAFSLSHRLDASITMTPKLLPKGAGLGFLQEFSVLRRVREHPQRPVVMLLGKLEDNLETLGELAKFSDLVLLGGRLANLTLKVLGYEIGKSVCEEGDEKVVREVWRDHQAKIKLPRDVVVSTSLKGEPELVNVDQVKPRHLILDIGPQTIRQYSGYLKGGRTLIWSGPLGYIQNKAFSAGTRALVWYLSGRSRQYAFGLAGGRESLEVLEDLKLVQDLDYVCSGGGAMLHLLAFQTLPGIEALKKYD